MSVRLHHAQIDEYDLHHLISVTVFLGFNGGYGSAGLGLGPRYGNSGMKGPQQGRKSHLSGENYVSGFCYF